MSFFSCGNSESAPGRITGNPMHNLCEKACVEVKKVFDACMLQTTIDNKKITLSDYNPCSPTFPLTFVTAKNESYQAEVTELTITPIADKPHLARVQATIETPLIVSYLDANGVAGKAKATLSISEDVVLYIPDQSIIPYEIEAVCGVVCPQGVEVSNGVFSITACVTIILKVVMEVELLIPTYGYCVIPACQQYNEEVCSGFFELPLYPR